MNARNPGEAAQVGRYPPCTHTYRRIADAHALDFIAAHRNRARLRGICIPIGHHWSDALAHRFATEATHRCAGKDPVIHGGRCPADPPDRIRSRALRRVDRSPGPRRLPSAGRGVRGGPVGPSAGVAHRPRACAIRASGRKSTGNDQTAMLAAAGARLADTVVQLAAQYERELAEVEVWNEPDLSRYWPTGDVTRTFPPFADGRADGSPNIDLPRRSSVSGSRGRRRPAACPIACWRACTRRCRAASPPCRTTHTG